MATTGPLMRNFVRLIKAPSPHVRHSGFCPGIGGGVGVMRPNEN